MIKMVREPSNTPNIRNIDDIIAMRYAYGNQNGYVIGKGQEISYTINGSNFTVNSGRIVVQGVECDIDANGVTIVVDNVATTRYYSVYLQVNLATNQAMIATQYDTATYPQINDGDDLTANSSGVANTMLYHFIAVNGEISEVKKIIEQIDYTGTALVGYDINKGTIEERLTNLGFKQGNITFYNSFQPYIHDATGTVMEPTGSGSVSNITQNEFKRQGNYVLAKLIFDFDGTASTDSGFAMCAGAIGKVPSEFYPKDTVSWSFADGTSFGISSNGDCYVSYVSLIGFGTTIETSFNELYMGYEAKPIN